MCHLGIYKLMQKQLFNILGALGACVALSSTGCGPRPGPGGVTPGSGKSDFVSNLSSDVVRNYQEPILADWDASKRNKLEGKVSAGEGLAVVRYQKNGVQILNCKIGGEYAYAGMTISGDTIIYETLDDVSGNVPGFLTGGVASLQADYQKGGRLAIQYQLVGRKKSIREKASKEDLVGPECGKATHFVRAASIGAFAVAMADSSKVSGGASLFGAGVDTKFESSSKLTRTTGKLDQCEKATVAGEAPPDQCGAPFRIELQAIEGTEGAGGGSGVNVPECEEGHVWDGNKCTLEKNVKAFTCNGKDIKVCREQCDKGSHASCHVLGILYQRGKGGAPQDDAQAAAFFKQSCEANHQPACGQLGYHHYLGKGVSRDKTTAVRLFKKACDAAEATGCTFLARMTRDGEGVARSEKGAFALFKRACDAGDGNGCTYLGDMYARGSGVQPDIKNAAKLSKRACEAGSADGCARLAEAHAKGRGVTLDRVKAFKYAKQACDAESALGCTQLGLAYYAGKGVDPDKKKALDLFERACKVWDGAVGCAWLGLVHQIGISEAIKGTWRRKTILARDRYKAQRLFKQACDANNGLGCSRLGDALKATDKLQALEKYQRACELSEGEGCRRVADFYTSGIGVKRDPVQAVRYMIRGCVAGSRRSCFQAGGAIMNGLGTKREPARAIGFYKKGGDIGGGDSCNELGVAYAKGAGVKKDGKTAMGFLEKGCSLGDAKSCRNIGQLAVNMGASSETMQRLADQFGKACEMGDTQSCHDLGRKYDPFYKNKFPKDVLKAVRYYRMGCDKGYAPACKELAVVYRYGSSGVQKDLGKAYKLYSRACYGGDRSACDHQATMLMRGEGVPKDVKRAVQIRERVCKQGNVSACRSLARMFENGGGVAKDEARAAGLYKQACNLRSSMDCYTLAHMYESGKGVKKSEADMAQYLRIACGKGSMKACYELGYFQARGKAGYKKDRERGVASLQRGCARYAGWYKKEKDKIKRVFACKALKKLRAPLAPKPKKKLM